MAKTILMILIMAMTVQAQTVFAAPADVNKQQTARVVVAAAEILSIRSASAADGVGIPDGQDILWTNIDPSAGNLIRPTNHVDGKLDTGVVVAHNSSAPSWNLKIQVTGALVINGESKIKYYLPQPINKNTSTATNGVTVPASPPGVGQDWPKIPTTLSAIYTSNNDSVNTPFGTLVTHDVALDPSGLVTGQTYTASITYTASVTP